MQFDLVTILKVSSIILTAAYLIFMLSSQKKRESRFKERFLTRQAGNREKPGTENSLSELENIHFAGNVTSELKEKIRQLYCKRDLWVQIVFTLFAMIVFIMAILVTYLMNSDPPDDYVIRSISWTIPFMMFLASILLLFYALALPQIWWRWWWPKYEAHFGLQVSGEIIPAGIRLVYDAEPIPWENFSAVELNDEIVL